MNQHGVQEVQAPRLQHFQSSLTPSYNLSSVLSIIPGFQFFNRLRKENGLIEPPLTLNLSAAPATGVTPNLTEISNLAGETYQQFSNPWGFFTSGYIVGLLITVRTFLTTFNASCNEKYTIGNPSAPHAERSTTFSEKS